MTVLENLSFEKLPLRRKQEGKKRSNIFAPQYQFMTDELLDFIISFL